MGVVVLVWVCCVSTSDAATTPVDGSLGAHGGIVVLDAKSGSEMWRLLSARSSYFLAAPGNNVTVATRGRCGNDEGGIESARLVAFDARTGQQRWTRSEREDFGVVTATTVGAGASWALVPVDAAGVVVTEGGIPAGRVIGLDAESGKTRWRLPSDEGRLGASETLVFATDRAGDEAYVLHAFDRRDGSLRWTFGGRDPSWNGSVAVVAADRAAVVVANGGFLSQNPGTFTTFYVLDARTGKERSRFGATDAQISFNDFAMTDGLLVYTEGLSVVGRELSGGAVRWQRGFPAPPENVAGSPSPLLSLFMKRSADNQTVFAQSFADRVITALDARTGQLRWEAPFRTGVRVSAAGVTVLGASQYRLNAVDTSSKKPRWNYRVPAQAAQGTAASQINVWSVDGRLTLSTLCDQG
jgi:outer membrane protein assembly factor BamB